MRRQIRPMLFLALALTALLAAIGSGLAQSEKPAVFYVVDSSNSMWAQIEDEHKIVIARNVLGASFNRLTGKADGGIVTFGNKVPESCSDVNTVIPMSGINAVQFSSAISDINPKGATPIAKSLEQAVAEANAFGPRGSLDVVLVFDGRDTCGGDPCATAAQLKEQNFGLRIHPIAFNSGIGPEHLNLACVAENTGGSFYRATNQAEFEAAMVAIETLALKGAQEPEPVAEAPDLTNTQAGLNPLIATAPATQPDEPAMPDVPELRASVQTTAEAQITDPATNEVTGSVPPDPTVPAIPSTSETIVSDAVPASELVARLEQQIATETQPVRSGTLRLSATLTEETPAISSGLVWRIFSTTPDEQGNFRVISREESSAPVFQLQTGKYILHVAYGRANVTRELEISEGARDEVIVLNAGGLRLSSALATGDPLTGGTAQHSVFSSEQDEFGQRKLVMPSAPEGLIIRLNAGTYHVVSQYGDANAVVRADVQIKAGKLTDATISHSAARVTLKLVTEEGGEAIAGTSWSIVDEEGSVVAESVGAFPSYVLAAGNYTILARNNGESYNRAFSVIPGQDYEVEVLTK